MEDLSNIAKKFEKGDSKEIISYSIDLSPEFDSEDIDLFDDFDDYLIVNVSFIVDMNFVKYRKRFDLKEPFFKDKYEEKLFDIFENISVDIVTKTGELSFTKLGKSLKNFQKELEKGFCIMNSIDLLRIKIDINEELYPEKTMFSQFSEEKIKKILQLNQELEVDE